ncbi:MAG: type II toxin-antitoxin system VapB family antitoxin [Myxococcota bacterium]
MRTTIRIDDKLLAAAKALAAKSHRSLTQVIEDALRELLARRAAQRHAPPCDLPVFTGNGLRPGVDLDDSANLLELMDRPDAPA